MSIHGRPGDGAASAAGRRESQTELMRVDGANRQGGRAAEEPEREGVGKVNCGM